MGVSFANSTIPSMNVQFGALISCDVTCGLNGFTLGVKPSRYAIGTGLTYSPFPVSGNDVLTFARHLCSL